MNKRFFVWIICTILVLGGCEKGVKRTYEHEPQALDTLYTARAAMLTYGRDPDRALVIIDSALIVGNIDAYEADYLRAKVYAHSPDDPRLDEAIAICEDLLQRDSTSATSASTADKRSNILQLLMDTARMRKDYELWLKYAIEMVDLSRQWSSETEALRMEAEVGLVLTYLGRHDEGLAKLDQVIKALDSGAPSVDRMDAGIIARKRKIAVLEEDGNFEAVIPEGMAIIRKLEDYEKRPSAYTEDSYRLPPIGADRARYCQYYKSQAWAFIARAYARTTPPQITEARKYVRLLEQSDYGHTYGGRVMLAPSWKALEEWDKLLAIYAEVEARLGADTLNADYGTILKDRADAATAQGKTEEALAYMNRYAALQNQLNKQQQESEAQEYAARYHAKEQDRKIQEAENESARKDVIIIAFVALLLISGAFSYFFGRQRNQIGEKNRALVRMIDEQAKAQESTLAGSAAPDPELFRSIDNAIREERMYTNPNLQRQDVLDRFGISRRTFSDLMSSYAGGQSFTVYINTMRLQDAVHLLKEEPEMSLSDIAEKVGFTPATFRDQFKRQFGMTPTEYRQNL
ncbi:MAG: AraC family transcriptional regulator [Bacteroidales bacterium]|nr:AraC family transcriptional regulator [Bacteroidales bacterium]